MDNIEVLLFLFAIVLIIVSGLATVIGYFWASSTTKSAQLKQIKQAQDQLQQWKEQELISIKQQIYDAAKGQAIQEMQAQVRSWQENELQTIRKQMFEGIRGEAIKEAQEQLVKWRADDLENAKRQIWDVLSKEWSVRFDQWKVDAEKEIRKDAIDKSQSVTMGKMTEHLVPYLPGFGFNPSDARFIGSPIDLIVFDGLGDGDVRRVVFVEIKTGVSNLSSRERLVRNAVNAGKVEWLEVKVNLESPDVAQRVKPKRNTG